MAEGVTTTSTARSAAPVGWLRPSAVLFDLDGTISDSGASITTSIAETLAHFGYPVPSGEELLSFVGPPIAEGFQRLGGVESHHLAEVVADYRRRYRTRLAEAPIFAGMAELITDLHRERLPLAIATSKRQSMAEDVLRAYGLIDYFTIVCGAAEDESRGAKVDIIDDALAGLRRAHCDVSRAVMVGDRYHDIQGARAHGIEAILVAWGYGAPSEADGAVAVATTVDELRAMLLPTPRR